VIFFAVMLILFVTHLPAIRATLTDAGLLKGPAQTTAAPASAGGGSSAQTPASPSTSAGGSSGTTVIEPPAGTVASGSSESSGSNETPSSAATRKIYFVRVDDDGSIVRTPCDRALSASTTPLKQALEALLAGPTADEAAKGVRTLIPDGTSLLSVDIKDGTAQVNLSEDFKFNSYSQEGYMWSVRQIVWTATEFPSVKSVQFLIDGQVTDYLGEGIWLKGPLSRETL
jgi:spore germination protein GerM